VQQILHITLPMLKSTIMILTLLSVGKIFTGDVGLIYGIIGDNAMLFSTTDVIDTFVLRALRTSSDLGMSTAIGLWQSVMGFVLVLFSNRLARRYESSGALF
jgi:putative aldouronate transport system permease protein